MGLKQLFFFGRPLSVGQERDWTRFSLPLELEGAVQPRYSKLFLKLFTFFIFFACAWAVLAPIQEIAVAQGQVVPQSQVRNLQHLEGGVVEVIHVREGEIVEKDTPLITMSSAGSGSDLAQLKVRAQGLLARQARLNALINNQNDLGLRGHLLPSIQTAGEEAFIANQTLRQQEQAALESRIAQRQAEVEALKNEIAALSKQRDLAEEKLNIRKSLLEQGYTSRREYLESETDYESLRGRVEAMQGQLSAAEQALKEAQAQSGVSTASATRDYAEELAEVTSELREIEQQINKGQDRVERLVLRSPAKGIVQTVLPKSAGEVVRSGETILQIVPVEDKLIAEVDLRPEDVAYVHGGMEAEVKISSFDLSIFGAVTGTVVDVSPTTYQKPDTGQLFYKARILLEKNAVHSKSGEFPILPGMVLTAEIITGKKSFFRYMFKPVYRSLDHAFSER